MKKNLILGSFILFFCTGAGAQQLSNSDFEQEWEDCYPLTGYETENKTAVGLQPSGWRAANVAQLTETAELVTKVEDNGNTYVRMENKYVGAMGIGANAPGYLTLGKPWAYAKVKMGWPMKIEEADGGTYGGVEFKYRPDAISFKYKSSHGTENPTENFTVSAYSWKGTFTSEEKIGVVFSTPTPVTMSNRDRVVLGEKDAQTSGILVSSTTACFNDNADTWKDKTIKLSYLNDEIPEYFNIIFSSADYYGERSNIGAGNVLCIDDVKLIYYSDLKSLSYDGTPINIDNPENIQIAAKDFDLSKVSCTSGKGADIQTSYNEGTRILTITIEGNDISVNSENHHEYSVKIVPPASEVTLTDDRLIKVDMGTIFPSINSVTISESESKDGTVAFTMKNFVFAGEMPVGDVTLTGATLSYADNGSINITAPEQELPLLGGVIYTKVSLSGNVAVVNGKKELTADVNIKWYQNPADMEHYASIQVAVSAIPFKATLEGKTLKVTGSVAADEAAAVIPIIPTDANSPAAAPVKVDVNVVDLTETALTGNITSSAFEAKNPNTLFYAAEGATLTGNNVVKGTECENLVLTDGLTFNAPEAFDATNVTFNRKFTTGNLSTVVLPFSFDAADVNGTVYKLESVENGVLSFKSVEGTAEANVPYLVQTEGDNLFKKSLTNATVAQTPETVENSIDGTGVTHVGNFGETMDITSDGQTSWYGYNKNGSFVKVLSGTVKPFRSAIKSKGAAPSSFALKLDGTVTGILNLENPNAKVDVYTVSGVCVRKNVPAASALNGLSRGVYIVGGQKVVK